MSTKSRRRRGRGRGFLEPPSVLAVLAFCAIAHMAGCATYHQAAIDELSPRDRVRLQVEDRELLGLAAVENPMDPVDGRFVEIANDSATFQVRNAVVTLPRRSLVSLERRETDVTRSLLLSGAVAGGVYGLLRWFVLDLVDEIF